MPKSTNKAVTKKRTRMKDVAAPQKGLNKEQLKKVKGGAPYQLRPEAPRFFSLGPDINIPGGGK